MQDLLKELRAAGELTRLRILLLLKDGELTVSEFVSILGQSQPRVSRHLRILQEAGLIERHQEGTWAFFRRARPEGKISLAAFAEDRVGENDGQFIRDRDGLRTVRAERSAKAQAYFSAMADTWNQIRALHVPEEDVEACLISKIQGRSIETMLDIGTGTGRMLQIFAPHIKEALGLDLSADMLTVAGDMLVAENITHARVRRGDMYDLPLKSGTQDLVVIHLVLHYADNPEAVIAEAARVLKRKGLLLIADFAPHEEEFLREEHEHRRLGFADNEVSEWALMAGLPLKSSDHLKGSPLTVAIWTFEKSQGP